MIWLVIWAIGFVALVVKGFSISPKSLERDEQLTIGRWVVCSIVIVIVAAIWPIIVLVALWSYVVHFFW